MRVFYLSTALFQLESVFIFLQCYSNLRVFDLFTVLFQLVSVLSFYSVIPT